APGRLPSGFPVHRAGIDFQLGPTVVVRQDIQRRAAETVAPRVAGVDDVESPRHGEDSGQRGAHSFALWTAFNLRPEVRLTSACSPKQRPGDLESSFLQDAGILLQIPVQGSYGHRTRPLPTRNPADAVGHQKEKSRLARRGDKMISDLVLAQRVFPARRKSRHEKIVLVAPPTAAHFAGPGTVHERDDSRRAPWRTGRPADAAEARRGASGGGPLPGPATRSIWFPVVHGP